MSCCPGAASRPSRPWLSRPTHLLNPSPVLQLSAAALTRLPPPPRTHAHLLAQNAQSPHSIAAAAEALRGVSRQGAPPAPCDPHALQHTPSSSTSSPPCQVRQPSGGGGSSSSPAGHRAARGSAAVSNCHRGLVRPSTAQGRLGHGPPQPGGQGLGGGVQQPDMPRVVTAWSVRPGSPPELGGAQGVLEEELSAAVRCSLLPGAEAVERALRLSLTARPASGGSPTRRSDFLAQHRFLCARQQVMAEEVRCRRGEIQEWEESRRLLDGELRAQRQEDEARQKEEARLHLELTERWGTQAHHHTSNRGLGRGASG
ncbi:hypothetical protein HaLaN_15843 [Haematococcus lacustris]|uniref:Uncharacterized protein n=1 Tax=Haematococcus lacustris TaxID=44745 RepID=A0A699ZHL7_HAELA|nr:hypothetical protein HaLaN_15843 [Haematococcus lacustris]